MVYITTEIPVRDRVLEVNIPPAKSGASTLAIVVVALAALAGAVYFMSDREPVGPSSTTVVAEPQAPAQSAPPPVQNEAAPATTGDAATPPALAAPSIETQPPTPPTSPPATGGTSN